MIGLYTATGRAVKCIVGDISGSHDNEYEDDSFFGAIALMMEAV
jgi:hypothetical protein